MAIVTFSDAGLTAVESLFSHLTFSVAANDRVGLIAGNGRGKTTFLRTILGELDLTAGEVTRSKGLKLALVPQDVPEHLADLTLHEVVLDAISPELRDYESWRVDVVLDDLQAPPALHTRTMKALSGGWQRLGLIARAFVGEPDLMLLDEPTNHLDLEKLLLLENWIKTTARGTAMIIASHDRAFLDATTNRTLFLRPGTSHDFALPYTAARIALDEIDEADRRRQENELKEAGRLRRNAAKLTNIGVNSGSDLLTVKAKQLKERASKIEDAQKSLHKERSGTIELSNAGTHAKVLIALDDVSVATPDGTPLFRTGKQFIFAGDRIVLLGANGAGKSVFVRMLQKAIAGAAVDGVRATPSLVLGYADQGLSHVPDGETPMTLITHRFDVGDQRARALLAGAGFPIEWQSRMIGKLSFGQKSRLGLLCLRLSEPNFYLLDEPTNHIDIAGQEDLAAEIRERCATSVIVSHDRTFVRETGTRFWILEKKRLVEAESPDGFFARVAGAFVG